MNECKRKAAVKRLFLFRLKKSLIFTKPYEYFFVHCCQKNLLKIRPIRGDKNPSRKSVIPNLLEIRPIRGVPFRERLVSFRGFYIN